MLRNINNVPSVFENAYEKSIISYCEENNIKILKFEKFGHKKDGPLNEALVYNLLIVTNEEEVEKIRGRFDFDFSCKRGGSFFLNVMFHIPSLKANDVDYSCYSEEELDRAGGEFKAILSFFNAFVRDCGLEVDGIPNEEKFSKGFSEGCIGSLVNVVNSGFEFDNDLIEYKKLLKFKEFFDNLQMEGIRVLNYPDVGDTILLDELIEDAEKAMDSVYDDIFETVEIEGMQWYVLAKDGDRLLIWAKDCIDLPRAFGMTNTWGYSSIRKYLNEDFLLDKPYLRGVVIPTLIKTNKGGSTDDFYDTTDSVFLLSEADLFGTTNGTKAKEEAFTYRGVLIPNEKLARFYNEYWLRTPYDAKDSSIVSFDGTLESDEFHNVNAIRPALWVKL